MAHDFIIATGKLTERKMIREMQRCVSYKHQQFNERGDITMLVGSPISLSDETVSKPKGVEYFHGYADGVLYEAFGAERFDGGQSGVGGGAYVPVKMAKERLGEAVKYIIENHPPHQEQAQALQDYVDNVLGKAKGHVTVIYC